MAKVEAALKVVFDRHEFNLQYTSFDVAHDQYLKAIEAWNTPANGLLYLRDDFSREVTIDPQCIVCVNVAKFKEALEGDISMASEQQKAQIKLQREAQQPSGLAVPGPRLAS